MHYCYYHFRVGMVRGYKLEPKIFIILAGSTISSSQYVLLAITENDRLVKNFLRESFCSEFFQSRSHSYQTMKNSVAPTGLFLACATRRLRGEKRFTMEPRFIGM